LAIASSIRSSQSILHGGSCNTLRRAILLLEDKRLPTRKSSWMHCWPSSSVACTTCIHYFSPFCNIGCPCYTPKDTTLKFKEKTDKGERSNKADEGEGMHEVLHESEGMCEGKGAVDEDEAEDKDDDEIEDEGEGEGENKSESEDES